jgi:hypothetical protein
VNWHGLFLSSGQPMEGTGVWRVNGNLAVSRAVGDANEKPFVSGVAEIKRHRLCDASDHFIVVATE